MDSRRFSEGINSTDISATYSLLENADLATQLLAQLCEGEPSESILNRMLSARSIVSIASSFVSRQQQAQFEKHLQTYRAIGRGTCGIVFEHCGFPTVLKKELEGNSQLWNDYIMHQRIIEAFDKARVRPVVKVPQCAGFIGKGDHNWWNDNEQRFPEPHKSRANLLISERIVPLPRMVREALIDLYFPPGLPPQAKTEAMKSERNKDCLARVYLGKRRDPNRRPAKMFTLVNFNLHMDQMEKLGLDTDRFAIQMADALCLLHWVAKVDANDVEFVLGSSPLNSVGRSVSSEEIAKLKPGSTTIPSSDFRRRAVHMWLLDFNRCSRMSMDDQGVEEAVKAFFYNDPYFPRPLAENAKDQQLWDKFAKRYIQSSTTEGFATKAELFISKVTEARRVQLEARPFTS